MLGNRMIELPAGHTWESFAKLLLDTMPPKTADHYRDKLAVYLQWYRVAIIHRESPNRPPGDCGAK